MITDRNIFEYATQYTSPEDEVLHRLNRETHLTTVYPNMLSGPLQGKFLELISRILKPRCILEIGTFTGYSAICLAKGLAPGGVLHTIDINDELAFTATKFFREAGLEKSIILHTGDAINVIPGLKEEFDLVFIDGDKKQYPRYYELVLPKVRSGGVILVDNVLWDGKVLDSVHPDKETAGIREFNDLVIKDSRVDKILLPFRDGIYLLYKR